MATTHEQQLATEIVVAWLHVVAAGKIGVEELGNPARAADIIATLYKATVQAIRETSTLEGRGDATE